MKLRKIGLLLGIAPFALGATFLGACGDDDGGGGGGSGSDEDFVAGLCDAFLVFQEDLQDLFSDLSDLEDEEEAAKAMAEPFEKLAESFEDLNPPSDLRDWHEDASEALNEAAEQLKDGNVDDGIFAGDQPFDDPPQDVQDRLQAIAEDNDDCIEADFTFDE